MRVRVHADVPPRVHDFFRWRGPAVARVLADADVAICTRGMAGIDGGHVVSITDHQIRVAIAGRRLIRFTYGSASRVAEPHDYGERSGVAQLLVYQLRSTPFSRGWRMLEVSKMSGVQVLDDTFAGSRGRSHTHHFEWDTLFLRVE